MVSTTLESVDADGGRSLILQALEALAQVQDPAANQEAQAAAASWLVDNGGALTAELTSELGRGSAELVVEACRATVGWFLSIRALSIAEDLAQLGVQAASVFQDLSAELMFLQALGIALQRQGAIARARTAFEQVLAKTDGTNPQRRAQAIAHLGQLARWERDLPVAARLFSDAIVLYREAGDKAGEVGALKDLALVLHDMQEPEAAAVQNLQALEIAVSLDDMNAVAGVLVAVARDEMQQGHFAQAAERLREALDRLRQLSPNFLAAEAQLLLAKSLTQCAQFGEATEAADQARNAGETLRHQGLVAAASLALRAIDFAGVLERFVVAADDFERDTLLVDHPLLGDEKGTLHILRARYGMSNGVANTVKLAARPAEEFLLRRLLVRNVEHYRTTLLSLVNGGDKNGSFTLPSAVYSRQESLLDASVAWFAAALGQLPEPSAAARAYCHATLASLYMDSNDRDSDRVVELRIWHGEVALRFRLNHPSLHWIKRNAHAMLSPAYRNRRRGEAAANREAAFRHGRLALVALRPSEDARSWIAAMGNLANVYGDARGAGRPLELQRAVNRLEAAYVVAETYGLTDEAPMIMNNLARVLMDDSLGRDPKNLERAIALLQDVEQSEPEEMLLAAVHKNLAYCFMRRSTGDLAADAQAALGHARRSFDIYLRRGDVGSAADLASLTGAVLVRDGSASAIDSAISWYEYSIRLSDQEGNRLQGAATRDDLGTALPARAQGIDSADLDTAIAHHRAAVVVYREEGIDVDLALALEKLADALQAKGEAGDRPEVEALYREAIKLFGLVGDLRRAATARMSVARLASSSGHDLGLSEELLDSVIKDLEDLAVPELRDARRMRADLHMQRAEWLEAAQMYSAALDAAENSYRAAVLGSSKKSIVQVFGDMPLRMALALAHSSRPREAATVLERFRARMVGDRLALDSSILARLQASSPALHDEYFEAASELRVLDDTQLQTSLRLGQNQPSLPVSRISALLAQQRLAATVDRIRSFPGFADFLEPTSWNTVAGAVRTNRPLAYLLVTTFGSCVVLVSESPTGLVTANSLMSPLTDSEILAALTPGVDKASINDPRQRGGISDGALAILGEQMIKSLADTLRAGQVEAVTLIACGLLARLPVHAAPYLRESRATCLLEELVVSYTPSARMRRAALVRIDSRPNGGLCLVGNPEPAVAPLPFSEYEVLAINGFFDDRERRVLIGERADKASVLAAAREARVIHLACHGSYNFADPLASGLSFAAGERVSLGELMASRDVDGVRLVIASACESAIVDIGQQSDEALGFPAGFLQAGATAYVGSLWSVNDVSASLLMIRFHQALKVSMFESELRVGAALRQAALWLRDVTASEVLELLQTLQASVGLSASAASNQRFEELLDRVSAFPPEFRPFANPTHWAPFVLVGTEG